MRDGKFSPTTQCARPIPSQISDADAILNEVPGVVTVSLEVSAEYLQIKSRDVESVTMFSQQQVASAAKVTLLVATVVAELFEGGDPVGEIIRIRNVPFEVIGALKAKGTFLVGSYQDDRIIVPYNSAMKRLTGDKNRVRRINNQAESPPMMPVIEEEMNHLLRERHRLPEGVDNNFMIRTKPATFSSNSSPKPSSSAPWEGSSALR